MTFKEYLSLSTTLNIFCDASITKVKEADESKTIGCSGFIAVGGIDNEIFRSSMLLGNVTNNRAELQAMFMSVMYANSLKNCFKNINIFSDSKLCVYSIIEWIYQWIGLSSDTTMYNKSGEVVKNQDIILWIIKTIIDNSLSINIFHQKGHVTYTQANMKNASEVFFESNHFECDMETLAKISSYNNAIDIYTKNQLASVYYNSIPDFIVPILCCPDQTYPDKLRKLLNGGVIT